MPHFVLYCLLWKLYFTCYVGWVVKYCFILTWLSCFCKGFANYMWKADMQMLVGFELYWCISYMFFPLAVVCFAFSPSPEVFLKAEMEMMPPFHLFWCISDVYAVACFIFSTSPELSWKAEMEMMLGFDFYWCISYVVFPLAVPYFAFSLWPEVFCKADIQILIGFDLDWCICFVSTGSAWFWCVT